MVSPRIYDIFVKNKYLTWYINIINNAQSRTHNIKPYEKHHIIPKCIGGTDDTMVTLTLREHYICHCLLPKLVNNKNYKYRLLAAICRMQSHPHHQRYTSKLYEYYKIQFYKLHSENQLGKEIPLQQRISMSRAKKGQKWSTLAKQTSRNKKTRRKVNQLTLDNTLIRQWDSLTSAATTLLIDVSSIYKVCIGISKTAGKFKWEYVDNNSTQHTELEYQQIDNNGKVINTFSTSIEAGKHAGYHHTTILNACKNNKQLSGCTWKNIKREATPNKITCINNITGTVKNYHTIMEASIDNNIHISIIKKILSKKQKQTRQGLTFLLNE